LIGPGGIGKTRIAVEVAREYAASSSIDTCYVALANVTSADVMISAIAAGLGASLSGSSNADQELLICMRDRQLLLVLDNFEQLVEDGTSVLAAISREAPGVQLLVTSRERLNLQAERAIEIEGLAYPDVATGTAVDGYDAIDLFAQRANQVQPRFDVAEHAQSEAPMAVARMHSPAGRSGCGIFPASSRARIARPKRRPRSPKSRDSRP